MCDIEDEIRRMFEELEELDTTGLTIHDIYTERTTPPLDSEDQG